MKRKALPAALLSAWLGLSCDQPIAAPVPPIVPSGSVVHVEPIPEVAETDWPWWRGPNRDGVAADQEIPAQWSQTQNVLWSSDVPGRGHSSPVLWGEKLFLTSADEAAEKQLILCYERKSGKPLWSTAAHEGGLMRMHPKNTHASATAACDGQRVYAAFINQGSLHVTATDLDGKILWQREAGPFGSEHGYASSPVLHKSWVIVLADNMTGSFIAAMDRSSGKLVWRTPRETTGQHGSYASPVVAHVAGRAQLLLHGMGSVSSYDPETGKLLWSCRGPAEVTACTVAFSDEWVFASGGFPVKELLAIRADGSGDVSDSHVVWRSRQDSDVTYVPSPLYHEGYLYTVTDGGFASCFDAETGKRLWQQRLGSNFSASPVLAGGLIFIPDEAGKTFVIKAGTNFEFVAQNDLGDGGFATPVVCGGKLFLRTNHRLYCIGNSGVQTARTQPAMHRALLPLLTDALGPAGF